MGPRRVRSFLSRRQANKQTSKVKAKSGRQVNLTSHLTNHQHRPDEATVEMGRNEMAAFMHAAQLFAVTMDDAVATLGEAAATMNNLFKSQCK